MTLGLSGGRAGARPIRGAIAGAAAALVIGGCGNDRTRETAVSLQLPTWFEDGWSYFEVSPAGDLAAFGARFGFRLLDLPAGEPDSAAARGPLDEVEVVTFHPSGAVARRGRRGTERGWYVGGEEGIVRKIPVPPDAMVRWASEGSRVAWYRPGQAQLALGPEPDSPAISLAGGITGVAWTPDGSALYALVLAETGLSTLVRVDAAGAAVSVVREWLDAPHRFSALGVSPDGSVFLALASDTVPDPYARHAPQADRDTDIYRLHLATGDLDAVVMEPGDDFYPQIAGGALYWTHNGFRDDVVVVPAAGGEPRVVVPDAQIPYWSHDGTALAFTTGGWRIADWALNLDAALVEVDVEARAVSDPRPIVQGYHEDFTPAWSPDGSWIAYHSHRSPDPVSSYASPGSTDDIYIRRPDAPTDREIRLTDFGWEVGMADWDPDGRRLVFDSWDPGSPGISKPWIAAIDPTDGRLQSVRRLPLPDGVRGTLLAAWSPGGDRIAFVERVAGPHQRLWVIAPDGTGARRLLDFRSATYGGLDWTPDGGAIVYAALAGERMQLFVVSSEGGAPRQLTRDEANLMHPQVSPDGRWIAASRTRRTKELRKMDL